MPCTWSVDKTNIATIDSASGVLKAVSAGTCTVTATTTSAVVTTTGKPVSQTIMVTVQGAGYTYVFKSDPFSGSSNKDGLTSADQVVVSITVSTKLQPNYSYATWDNNLPWTAFDVTDGIRHLGSTIIGTQFGFSLQVDGRGNVTSSLWTVSDGNGNYISHDGFGSWDYFADGDDYLFTGQADWILQG